MITELNERSQAVLRYIVDAYMETGEPVGSRTISKDLGLNLSAASIRNVMADLESMGYLHAPHTSAGRLPTQNGLRMYVDGLMEIGNLTPEERQQIEARCAGQGQSVKQMLEHASTMLSGLSSAASLVIAPKVEKPLKQVQFVRLSADQVLIILVTSDGMVENRIMQVPPTLPDTALTQATNYLSERLQGLTLHEAQKKIREEIENRKTLLDQITSELVEKGIALDPGSQSTDHIIIRGQSNLLNDVKAIEELEHARQLFDLLEEQKTISGLIKDIEIAEGVQIFIGSENKIFEHSGWSMVLSPYKNEESQIIGAIGVIGPLRLNYSRIIPILDYTSKVMGRLIG